MFFIKSDTSEICIFIFYIIFLLELKYKSWTLKTERVLIGLIFQNYDELFVYLVSISEHAYKYSPEKLKSIGRVVGHQKIGKCHYPFHCFFPFGLLLTLFLLIEEIGDDFWVKVQQNLNLNIKILLFCLLGKRNPFSLAPDRSLYYSKVLGSYISNISCIDLPALIEVTYFFEETPHSAKKGFVFFWGNLWQLELIWNSTNQEDFLTQVCLSWLENLQLTYKLNCEAFCICSF